MQGPASTELEFRRRSRRGRRRIVVLSLLGAVITAVSLVIFSWSDLERAYYLWQLRRQPGLVEPWLRAGEEDHARLQAVRKFFLERQGAEILFGLYLAEYDKRQYDQSTIVDSLTRRQAKGSADHGYMYLSEKNYGHVFMRGKRALGMYSTINVPADLEMRRLVLAELDACVGQSFIAPELPGYEFHIESIIEGESRPPPWSATPVRKPGKSRARHVCYFRLLTGPPSGNSD